MPINNAFYDDLGDRWYDAHDDPVALLRVESSFRNPLIGAWLDEAVPGRALRVLDVGCGGGFLSNFLAEIGHEVTGVDLSPTGGQECLAGERRRVLKDVHERGRRPASPPGGPICTAACDPSRRSRNFPPRNDF